MSSAATATIERLLAAPGVEPVKHALMMAVAELHLHAGWAAFGAGLYGRAMRRYARALELAIEAGDAYCQVLVLNRAGLATVEHGHPNDGLKMLHPAGQGIRFSARLAYLTLKTLSDVRLIDQCRWHTRTARSIAPEASGNG